jgi:hypothetical protein
MPRRCAGDPGEISQARHAASSCLARASPTCSDSGHPAEKVNSVPSDPDCRRLSRWSQRLANPRNRVLDIGDRPAVRGRVAHGDGDGASRSLMNSPKRPPPGAVAGRRSTTAMTLLVRDSALIQRSACDTDWHPRCHAHIEAVRAQAFRSSLAAGAGDRCHAHRCPARGKCVWWSGRR